MSTTKAKLLKVIRQKCLDCACGEHKSVRVCTEEKCPNWPFRMGTDPYKTPRQLTDAQKAALDLARKKAAEGRTKKSLPCTDKKLSFNTSV